MEKKDGASQKVTGVWDIVQKYLTKKNKVLLAYF